MEFVLECQSACWNWRVKPFIKFQVVILTAYQLHLQVAVVASESVNSALVIDSREESLFMWHISTNFDCLSVVMQIVVLVAVASHQEDPFIHRYENLCEMRRKWLPIFSTKTPIKLLNLRLSGLILNTVVL